MKKIWVLFAVLITAFATFESCKPEQEQVGVSEAKLVLPETPYDYKAEMASFAADLPSITLHPTIMNGKKVAPFNNFFVDDKGVIFFNNITSFDPRTTGAAPNNLKNEIATLGRVLFYDKQLSVNNTIACGSCHLQEKAFSDISDVSTGFKGVKTTRNSMTISNPVLTNNLFWDSRSKSLQDMVLKPVQNHIEMGMEDLSFLNTKLQGVSYYPELFRKAFGSTYITTDRVNTALLQFLSSMVSHNSKFDDGAKNNFANFSALEMAGKDLFMSARLGCDKCHAGVNFSLADENTPFGNPYNGGDLSSPQGTANIGLDMVYKDNGRGNGKLKIPTLRNIELTAPYMHDGRFKTLEEVVEHYNNGIKGHPSLDDNLKDANGQPKKLNLTALEKTALIAFLKTLTDTKYTTDVKYSNPFKS